MTATPPDDTHPHDDPVISPDRDHRGMLIAIMLEWLIAIVGIRNRKSPMAMKPSYTTSWDTIRDLWRRGFYANPFARTPRLRDPV